MRLNSIIRRIGGQLVDQEMCIRDSPYTDLALLKVIPDFRAEAFDLGDSSLCKKGEWVMACLLYTS